MSARRKTAKLSLGTLHFQEANEKVRECLENADTIELIDVYAQRYLGCTMPSGKRINIHGIPGNDMAAYMDGGTIEVFGNAQDQIGNTMNDGLVIIHGRCGDATGYAMRGGSIFIRDDCGWRVGIHMKQFEKKCPAVIIGGDAGNFLGEYMAGGIIVLMGKPGEYLASGMHGGVIYLRHKLDEKDIPQGLVFEKVGEEDVRVLTKLLGQYDKYFKDEIKTSTAQSASEFFKLSPKSSRPYASMYAN